MFHRNETRSDAAPRGPQYRWDQLEEYLPDGGMWSIPSVDERDGYIRATAKLMADPTAFEASMLRALDEWPMSTSVALGNPSLNQRAWLGHAGCYLATGSPEETTRLGWHELDDAQQRAANAAADRAIAESNRRSAPEPPLTLFGDTDA